MPHTAPVSPDEIQRHPRVSAARDHIIATDERTLRDQIDLTELPAPPFGEEARAEKMLELLAETGLSDVRADEAGNVIGVRLGQAADPAGASLSWPAHLDGEAAGGGHTLYEWYRNAGGPDGICRALYTSSLVAELT